MRCGGGYERLDVCADRAHGHGDEAAITGGRGVSPARRAQRASGGCKLMHFTFGFPLMTPPQNPEFLSASALGTMTRAAEDAGFAAVSLTEHPIPHDDWLATGGHDALDPFVGLSFAAAATSRVRLLTNLTPLPYRNPALLAKTVATLDRLSGGRVILGVGTGYLEKEFAALGVDFGEGNALFGASPHVLRTIWTGRGVT